MVISSHSRLVAAPGLPPAQWRMQAFLLTRKPSRFVSGIPVKPRRVLVYAPWLEAAVLGSGVHRDELYRRSSVQPWELLDALRPVSAEDVADFFQILGSALGSGQSMTHALAMAARQARSPRMRGVIGALAHLISRGDELHRAFQAFPEVFGPTQIALATVAAETGLDRAGLLFCQLATRMQRDAKLGRKFIGALSYPASLLVLSVFASLILELKALPPMVELFKSMGASLPPITQNFYAVSQFIEKQFLFLLPLGLAAASLLVGVIPRFLRWRLVQHLSARIWAIGPIVLGRSLARALGTFLLLKQSGANNRDIFTLAAASSGNALVSDFFLSAYRRVTLGESIEEAFLAERHCLGLEGVRLAGRMEVGMEGADLEPLLQGSIDELIDKSETRVALLPKLLELPLLAVCGLIVGTIILAMFLPYPSLLGDVARQMHGGGP